MAPPICTQVFKLNNGLEFPAVGLGTWQGSQGTDDAKALEESIIHALKVGYRLIDTAQLYGVEEVVGKAIRNSGVPRSEIIVVTKFWGEWHHDPAAALQISLDALGLDYIDVFLMHWPWATTPAPEKKVLKKWESPTFIETWKLMESLVGEKCRTIGVSNFMPKLVPYCQEKGIHVMGWSTLGGSRSAQNEILTHELFTSVAKAHDCSTGVVSLSWAVQRGTSIIPKSANKSRIEENIRLVTLTDEEMNKINDAHKTIRKERFSNNIESQHMVIDGVMTQQGWTYVDMGYEDENGNWLV
ncbi:putative aldo/keto reductase [Colletotrichum asianum]|uniref:Putative aldo/keto reductase n=1 Tax=Colletotrichum asianum TaxID=702518 RepID=A0A8H3WAF0_9PEZI|nr:putative aldo/keto reductase [Colletotrichum asianum]